MEHQDGRALVQVAKGRAVALPYEEFDVLVLVRGDGGLVGYPVIFHGDGHEDPFL
ncbi:hypothetical protein [Streptomyces pseudovenezuelae]|uniref:hypothetical protein n=1 Tax=Streptomyces pseudovenezuelae TaxID=67350 RepID=UPI001428906B|nr:hypothetical protein [Streptomyces pseudovenezuelae]